MTAPTAPPVPPAPPAPPVPAGSRRRRVGVWLWVVLGLGLVVLGGVLFLGRPDPRPPPLSPTSEWPDGTKGLVMLLEEVGAEVDVSDDAPDDVDDLADVDVVFLPVDYLYDLVQVDALWQWVDAGGRLVVADPYSQYTSLYGDESVDADEVIEQNLCTIDALEGIDAVVPGEGSVLYATNFGEGRCFTRGDDAFVTAYDEGAGTVVSVGGAAVFTNDLLDDAGNAGLAVALLAPEPGTRVRYLDLDLSVPPPDVDRPEAPNPLAGFFDMIPPIARLGLAQAIVAFLAYAWWQGRRLGRPVPEPQPVEVEGSELVQAVARLLERSRDPGRAAAALRTDLRRTLSERLGLPADVADDVLVTVVAERTGVEPARVRAAIAPSPADQQATLTDLARLIETIRQEVLHGTAP